MFHHASPSNLFVYNLKWWNDVHICDGRTDRLTVVQTYVILNHKDHFPTHLLAVVNCHPEGRCIFNIGMYAIYVPVSFICYFPFWKELIIASRNYSSILINNKRKTNEAYSTLLCHLQFPTRTAFWPWWYLILGKL